MIEIKKGNIFTTDAQTIVNTVNCVGFMGAGIALEFKFRHLSMFEQYKKLCEEGHMDIGKLWLYKLKSNEVSPSYEQILNFPTKNTGNIQPK